MPQPLWELRLNPDYGTLPGVPLLEALQGVGILGAGVPPYSQRAVSMNIYVSGPAGPPLASGEKYMGHFAEIGFFCFVARIF